jgi:hypothetical protein
MEEEMLELALLITTGAIILRELNRLERDRDHWKNKANNCPPVGHRNPAKADNDDMGEEEENASGKSEGGRNKSA